MDFATMGRVGSYIKQKNLSFAANYKIRTGQRVTDNRGNLSFTQSTMFEQINKTTKKVEDEVKAARLRSIKQKLMNGKKLSTEEMGFLLKNSPDLYKKAKHADEAREELKSELKDAKTKQEARQILNRAMIKASAEASAEISACKGGMAVGGAVGGISMTGEISISAENISASTQNISMPTENISVNETPSPNENVLNGNQNLSENKFTSNQNSAENNSDENKDSTQSIMEKFLMTIRALEDEWTKFTNSDEYKDLPEDSLDEKIYTVATPKRKFLDAIYTYRKSVNIA